MTETAGADRWSFVSRRNIMFGTASLRTEGTRTEVTCGDRISAGEEDEQHDGRDAL